MDVASPPTDAGQTSYLEEDCLDGANVVDPVAPLETVSAHSTDAEEMEAQTDPVAESEHVSSPLSGAALDPPNLVAESAVGSVSQISSDPQCEVQAPRIFLYLRSRAWTRPYQWMLSLSHYVIYYLSFASLYAPNKNPERNLFFSSIPELIDLSRTKFICGDFNSVLDSTLDRKRRSSYIGSQAAQYQESGPALQSLLSATQTYLLWQTLHQGQTSYSWTHGSGQFASRIDMVWAPTVFQDNIKECEYHPSFFSDHSYLLVKFDLEQGSRGLEIQQLPPG